MELQRLGVRASLGILRLIFPGDSEASSFGDTEPATAL